MKLKISDSVVALLTKEIERLPSDLQYGLQVASCIGSCLADPILCCLSKDLGYDLTDILRQVSQKGFMIEIASSTMFCFAHDKIQEAVYGLMSEQQRRDNHVRFGLVLCNHTLNYDAENEELLFVAVNQLNQGGSGSVHDPSLKNVIAELNLKAGRRSIDLSDYNTAFKLFQHGISFLGDEKWTLQYQLSVALYDVVSGAAFVLNNLAAVRFYTDEVVTHARCFDDKLNCKTDTMLLRSMCIYVTLTQFPHQYFTRFVHCHESNCIAPT
jgi:predicted ATPase